MAPAERAPEQRAADWAAAMTAWHKACDLVDDAMRQGCSDEHLAKTQARDDDRWTWRR